MDDEIPQSFKVQWVYTTLRYLKDDTQMIMEYPEMPVNHMEYLHNLIWQRKHEVGLGVRSMYAPVWETMRIFSSKYRYKVFVNKSADGTKGYLVIEKIPKKENQEPDTQENLERANEIPDCQSSDSESESSQSQLESSQSQLESSQSHLESNQSQPESPVHYPVGTQPKKTNTIAIRKKTKSEKFLISKHKIIESISPVLLRKTLQHILDFLLKKEEASIIFSDLAPVEAKFLENFLGIFNKRISFRDILSPACNELLDKMCEFFKEFDKACKLEVYAAKYNVHTKKREVTFMKVPRYTRSNANESQENIVTPQVNIENIPSVAPFSKENIPKPISSQTSVNSNSNIITISNENTTKGDIEKKKEIKLSMDAENGEGTSSINATNIEGKLSMLKENVKEKLSANSDTEDNFAKNLQITDKLVVLNKDLLKHEIEEIALPKNGAKIIPAVKKIDKPTISKIRARSLGPTDRSVGPTNRSLGPRKDRLLVAMSTPLESDKAMRMMRLMGWQGGALGPRGDGIVEPIIPALDIVRGKGFGHVVKEKPKSTKPVKPVKKSKVEEKSKPVKTSQTEDRLKPVQTCQTEEKLNPVDTPQTEERLKPVKTSQTEEKLKPVKTLEERLKPFKTSPTEEKLKPVTSQIKEEPPKPVKLNRRVLDRMEFLHKILDLISKDRARREQAVTYPVKLCQRQKICYDNIICVLNKRKHTSITLTEHENEILKEIASVMDTEPHLTLDMMVSSDQRELTITKKIDFVVNTTDRMRWPTLSKETQDLQENVNLEKKMTKSEFEIHICSTVLEFLISEDSERWIDFDAALTEKCCDVVETICSCVNNKVAIPYKPVKELSDKILQVNNACFLDVQFYAKPTRSILLRKLNCRKPAINTEVIKNIIKRCIDTTVPNADDANNQRKPETIKASNKEANKQNTDADINTNKATANNTDNTDKIRERLIITNDISKPDSTASHPSIDSIHYSAVDDKVIQENMRKRNVRNECNGTKLNNSTVNSSEDIMAKASEKFKWFPLYAKDMNTGDNNDFRRIDIDLIQVTINLLTYNNNNNNTDTIPNDHENNDFNINDNSKYIESSKLNDKLDIPCKITDNMRKWYDRSEKFLICDDITTLVEIKNSSYNNDQVTNVEINKSIGVKVIHAELNISTTTDKTKNCCKADTNDSIESEILNEDVEKQSQFDEKQIENVSQNLKLIDEYEVSDGIRGSTDDVESKESHQTGDKSSQSDTIQVKANNSEDLKSKYVPDVCSDSQNSDVIIVSESHQEVKNHSKIEMIQLESIKVDKQAFEAFNDIKATINEIESEISNQIKTHTKSDIILIDGNSSENLNATSLNEVLTNTKDSKTEIGSKESHPVDRKHSELDIVEIEKEELSDYGSEESFDTDEIMQVIRQNEDCLSDCETDNSSETLQTDEANSNLDIIQVDSNYEEDSTLKSKNEPKESLHNEETHSMKEKNEMEANNIKDIKRTNEFERDETRKELKEVEIETKLEMSIIKTNCNENLSRKRKYEATELDESYEAVEVKHKFCITSINDDNIEDLRLISRTVDSEDSEKTKEINSKLDIIHTGTDSKENSTLEREFGLELPEESHKIDETSSKSDGLRVSENYEEIATLESEFKIGLPEESHKIDEIIIDANSKLGAGYKENLPLENEFKVELLEESDKIDETDSKSDELRVEENYEEIPTLESEFKIGLLEESHLIDEINSKLAVIQVGMDYTENSRLKSEFEEELLQESHKIDETNSKLDVFQVREDNKENLAPESGFKTELLKKVHKIDEINSKLDTGNDSKHANETQIKDLNNRNKEIDKTCHDIVLIESNILETEVIQRKIQNAIENMDSETEFLPLLKYHGILNKGIIYSCHNKGTSVWLRNILPDHSVIDYKSAINNHKLKVKAISFNKNAKKFLELLEVYNQGIKSRNWKIISEKYYKNNLLIVRVEMDSNSFEYVCDNNFSLFVGYDIAQFTIGC